MKKIHFELCAETLDAALAGAEGGADRVELCSDLRVGGVTPDAALIDAALSAIRVPLHVLVRPRGGDFVYSEREFAVMRESITRVKAWGVQGIVIGLLTPEGRVDVQRMRAIADAARPLRITFHRAFDACSDLSGALEDVIEAGADALLTSGGAADVRSGACTIGKLTRQAGGRIEVIAGGGLRLDWLASLLRETGVHWVHGSLTREASNGGLGGASGMHTAVQEATRILRELEKNGRVHGSGADHVDT